MCGRYVLTASSDELVEYFAVDRVAAAPSEARYNVAPSQFVPAVAMERDGTSRRLERFRWGLIPPWADSAAIGNKMINARAETLTSSRAYRDAYAKRRCLIPADGFYEWQHLPDKARGPRLPWYFAPREGGLLALGGLWERWRHPDGEWLVSCTVITTQANAVLAPVHDRMPVVVAPEHFATWLDPRPLGREEQTELLAPASDALLVGRRVSNAVSNPNNEGPSLLDSPEGTERGIFEHMFDKEVR